MREHIEALSGEIGARVAGSPEEAAAVEYASDQFESWGYDVETQTFPTSHDLLRAASLRVAGPARRQIEALPLVGAGSGDAQATLVDAGEGRAGDFPVAASGAVALVHWRDAPTLAGTSQRAEEAGVAALVIANREVGPFIAVVDPPRSFPVVSIDEAEGDALGEMLALGPVDVSVRVEERREVTSRNVIARPEGGVCRTLSGGHIDSVPVGRGAGDNASGSALVLELARATAVAGLEGHCFALFGAEEVGLVGSAHFVSQLTEEERAALEVYYNYDLVAGEGDPGVVATGDLLERALALADKAGLDVVEGGLPQGASSDHASFLDERIPSLMLTVASDPAFDLIHTARDTLANLVEAPIAPIATLAFALLADGAAKPGAALPATRP